MKTNREFSIVIILALCLTSMPFQAQAQQPVTQSNTTSGSARSGDETQFSNLVAQARPRRRAFVLMPESSYAKVSGPVFSITPAAAGPNVTVLGGGTVGRLTKWTGFNSSNSFVGDSNIYEDKNGLVGIGTDAPTSRLTVAGMIQSTSGGFKFPDGSIQTSAGIAANQVVRSLNGLMGDVTLAGSGIITVTPTGNTLTIAATGALTGVAHDATLTGNGTQASPLGVAVPLVLNGAGGVAGVIQATNTSEGGDGVDVRGASSNSGPGGTGVNASGGSSTSVRGGHGVFAQGGNTDASGGTGGFGVLALGGLGTNSSGGRGVFAQGGEAVGAGQSGGIGIEAQGGGGATNGLAGKFNGNVQVTGTLSKGGGSFKIDHPLDPENKYLYHSFVESPDMKNIYDGNVVTDENGNAVVELPAYFEALNRDFRYQLTVIGTFSQAIIAEKIKGNRFVIRTNAPNVEVSWQVTGVRQDAFAIKNRIPVEEEKPEVERGYYLHPEVFNQPEEKSILWARNPERMQQLRQQRIEAEQMRKPKQR